MLVSSIRINQCVTGDVLRSELFKCWVFNILCVIEGLKIPCVGGVTSYRNDQLSSLSKQSINERNRDYTAHFGI